MDVEEENQTQLNLKEIQTGNNNFPHLHHTTSLSHYINAGFYLCYSDGYDVLVSLNLQLQFAFLLYCAFACTRRQIKWMQEWDIALRDKRTIVLIEHRHVCTDNPGNWRSKCNKDIKYKRPAHQRDNLGGCFGGVVHSTRPLRLPLHCCIGIIQPHRQYNATNHYLSHLVGINY